MSNYAEEEKEAVVLYHDYNSDYYHLTDEGIVTNNTTRSQECFEALKQLKIAQTFSLSELRTYIKLHRSFAGY